MSRCNTAASRQNGTKFVNGGGGACGRDVGKKRRAACVRPYVSASEWGATPQMVGEKWAAAAVRALIPLAASANSDGRPRHSTSGERGQIPPLKMDADAES